MKTLSIITVSIINLIILIRYLYLIRKQKIQPSLAMWTFFTLAVGMSLITYMKDGNYSLLDNILNSADMIMVATVALGIYFFGEKNSRFNSFEKFLLIIVAVIIFFWIFTKNHFLANIFIQLILVIAYIPVVSRIVKSKQNSEPFSVWILLLIAPIISFISLKGDLAAIYAWRTIACSSGLLLLMIRTEMTSKKQGIKTVFLVKKKKSIF